MTFWQGLAITILAETTDVGGANAEEWAMSAQDFLICLEMLLFSIAHFYCFPTDEWEEDYKVNYNKAKFGDSIALGDFFADLKLIMKGNNKKKKSKPTEPTVPEGDEENPEEENADSQYESDEDEENHNDDATTSVTSDMTGNTTSELEDAKRVLASAIENEISESDSPEVEEARQRILLGGFLDDMAFMAPVRRSQSDNETGLVVEEKNEGTQEEKTEAHPRRLDYGAVETNAEQESEEAVTERTGLLSGGPSPLRPSIFTTIAAMHETSSFEEKREL
jgi:hypothetical protein